MSQSLNDCEILLGVTGGVAAWKAAELCSLLVQQGAGVSVILTDSAQKFIGRTTFEALTARPVSLGQFQPTEHFRGEHIGLAQRADLIVVAPATAASIARMAHGLADDLLTTTLLASTAPVLVAPAMNCDMWSKPSVRRNVAQLRDDGYEIIDPESGWLSCGQTGMGRMASPETIVTRITRHI
ncbi:MAG: phosphopantothenoylcysteine decarboxylase [Fuerstiella sp.]|nr:phosphopantothenoylcysteine decarboxylase [Fuerstiella sp.]